MPSKKSKLFPWVWGTAAALGGGVLYYLLAGFGGDKNAVLVPDKIEDQLDLVVARLNNGFGREWVLRGVSFLESALVKTLPAPLVALVNVVYRTERWAQEQQAKTGRKILGADKRSYAAHLQSA